MKNKGIMYYADEGHLIVRKEDDFIMGDGICLGENDSIENYEERAFTEEEIAAFEERVGIVHGRADKKNVAGSSKDNMS